MSNRTWSLVDSAPIDLEFLKSKVSSPTHGALFTFEGNVRNHDGGKQVQKLIYEIHPSAGQIIAEVVQEIAAEFPDTLISAQHRFGPLDIGECAFAVAVGSPHRAEGMRALEKVIEEVKARIPIWKNQIFGDGSAEWVNSA